MRRHPARKQHAATSNPVVSAETHQHVPQDPPLRLFLCERDPLPGGRWSSYFLVGVFGSLGELDDGLEAIDVEEGTYRAFDAAGRMVTLRPQGHGGVTATLEPNAEELADDLEAILRHELRGRGYVEMSKDPDVSLQRLVSEFPVEDPMTVVGWGVLGAVILVLLAMFAVFVTGLVAVIRWLF